MTIAAQVSPGWYNDGTGRQRWWDGSQWSAHFADQQGQHQIQVPQNQQAQQASEAQKAASLNQEVAHYARLGWTVQHASPTQVVLSRVARMGWFWNLILVLLTAGLWLIYVIYRALNRKAQSMTLTVDDFGRVHRS